MIAPLINQPQIAIPMLSIEINDCAWNATQVDINAKFTWFSSFELSRINLIPKTNTIMVKAR